MHERSKHGVSFPESNGWTPCDWYSKPNCIQDGDTLCVQEGPSQPTPIGFTGAENKLRVECLEGCNCLCTAVTTVADLIHGALERIQVVLYIWKCTCVLYFGKLDLRKGRICIQGVFVATNILPPNTESLFVVSLQSRFWFSGHTNSACASNWEWSITICHPLSTQSIVLMQTWEMQPTKHVPLMYSHPVSQCYYHRNHVYSSYPIAKFDDVGYLWMISAFCFWVARD